MQTSSKTIKRCVDRGMHLGVFIDSFENNLTYFFTSVSKDDTSRVKCVGYALASLVNKDIPNLQTKGDALRLVGTVMSLKQFSHRYCEMGIEVLAFTRKKARPVVGKPVQTFTPVVKKQLPKASEIVLEGWNEDEYVILPNTLMEQTFGVQKSKQWSEME